MIHSMVKGNPIKLIILFALPILLGQLFQQVYILSDLYILGRFLGVHALAVAGAMTPIFVMAIMLSAGFTNGLCVITAQRFGANDIKQVRRSFCCGLILTAIFCCILVVSVQSHLDVILAQMNVPTDIYDDSKMFLKILIYSLIATLFYNFFAGIMRSLGDSKTPLYFLIFASVLNIIINVTMIIHFQWNVTGVAIGTGIAQTISVLFCVVYIFYKYPILKLKSRDWKMDFSFVAEHLKMAIPMSVQFSIIGLSVIVVQSICNTFGTETIAAFTSASRIEQIATTPLFSLGMAMSTYTAQNYGSRYIRRIRQGVLQCFLIMCILSLCLAGLAYYWSDVLAGIFLTNPSQEVLNQTITYIQTTSYFYFFLGMIFLFRQVLQGIGYPILPLISSIVELFMRAFAALYLATLYGYIGICFAGPIAWLGGSIVVMIGYFIIISQFKVSLFGKLDQRSPLPRTV